MIDHILPFSIEKQKTKAVSSITHKGSWRKGQVNDSAFRKHQPGMTIWLSTKDWAPLSVDTIKENHQPQSKNLTAHQEEIPLLLGMRFIKILFKC